MSQNPLFASRCIDKSNSLPLRLQHLPAHLEWLQHPSTNVVFAGPLRHSREQPLHGSLIIMRAPNAEAITQTLLKDPFYSNGLFQTVSTRKWLMAMASDELPDNLYAVWCIDKEHSLQLRKETRPRHLDWWTSSGRRGIVGPFPCDGGANGSLIICEGESVEEVAQWAATDPYNQVGLFETVDVRAVDNVLDRVSKSKIASA